MKYTNKKTLKRKVVKKKSKNKKGGKLFTDDKMVISKIVSDTPEKIKKEHAELFKYKFVTIEKYSFGEKIIYDNINNSLRRIIFYLDNQSVFVSDIFTLNNFISIDYRNNFQKNINKKREIMLTFKNDRGNKVDVYAEGSAKHLLKLIDSIYLNLNFFPDEGLEPENVKYQIIPKVKEKLSWGPFSMKNETSIAGKLISIQEEKWKTKNLKLKNGIVTINEENYDLRDIEKIENKGEYILVTFSKKKIYLGYTSNNTKLKEKGTVIAFSGNLSWILDSKYNKIKINTNTNTNPSAPELVKAVPVYTK